MLSSDAGCQQARGGSRPRVRGDGHVTQKKENPISVVVLLAQSPKPMKGLTVEVHLARPIEFEIAVPPLEEQLAILGNPKTSTRLSCLGIDLMVLTPIVCY